jgi:hypothetical protein
VPVEFDGLLFEAETGGTPAHIYRTHHSNARRGLAVAKIFCMPYGKQNKGGTAHATPRCSHDENEVRGSAPSRL